MTVRRRRILSAWSIALFALLAFTAGVSLPGAAAQESGDAGLLEKLRYPKTIVLVRHAEKAADDPRDPSLSEAGVARAQALAHLLGHAGVTHLYATEYKRTRETLEPLSLVSGAQIQIVQARDPGALVSAVSQLPRHSVVVVAGHSNTVPELVKALSQKESGALGEGDYDRLYVVTRTGDDAPATLVELRYGAP